MTPATPRIVPEALLRRAPIALDPAPLIAGLSGRRVLVTGAGGSIGSELCRQIAALEPASLAMVDRAEFGLHAIATDLAGYPFAEAVVADVTDEARLGAVAARVKPEFVFHAAAHKHVSLMERHPSEAVKNNVIGTRLVAACAVAAGASRVVLISTDKAVEPTTIMGASKAVAELVIRGFSRKGRTSFTTVRFGNVMGSSGSVLPRFLAQVARGGPVTVTHPEVERYFMLTSEAVQLVLHAGVLPADPALCVLDLGKPIRIRTLAQDVIRLAGFDLDRMPITYCGLQPGEKLVERLTRTDEWTEATAVEHLLTVRDKSATRPGVTRKLETLERAALKGEDEDVVQALRDLVPTFAPSVLWQSAPDASDHDSDTWRRTAHHA